MKLLSSQEFLTNLNPEYLWLYIYEGIKHNKANIEESSTKNNTTLSKGNYFDCGVRAVTGMFLTYNKEHACYETINRYFYYINGVPAISDDPETTKKVEVLSSQNRISPHLELNIISKKYLS